MIEAVEVKMPICKQGSDRQNREKVGQGFVGKIEDIGFGDRTGRTYDERSCVEPVGSFAGINRTVETWLVCTHPNLAIGSRKRP